MVKIVFTAELVDDLFGENCGGYQVRGENNFLQGWVKYLIFGITPAYAALNFSTEKAMSMYCSMFGFLSVVMTANAYWQGFPLTSHSLQVHIF